MTIFHPIKPAPYVLVRAVTVQATCWRLALEDDFLSLVPNDHLVLDELVHLLLVRSRLIHPRLPCNLLAVDRIQGLSMHGVYFPGHVRTLNVLGFPHVLEFVVHLAFVSSATPGVALAEEGGRGVYLRQLLLPPLPLLPPDLVPLGGGLGLVGTGDLLLLGLQVPDRPYQTSPDRTLHVLLHPDLRQGVREH